MANLTDPDFLEKFAEIEVDDPHRDAAPFIVAAWRKDLISYHMKHDSPYTFKGVLDQVAAWEGDGKVVVATLYGLGGMNRYMVFGDGEVQISRRHSGRKSVAAAEALGFKVWV